VWQPSSDGGGGHFRRMFQVNVSRANINSKHSTKFVPTLSPDCQLCSKFDRTCKFQARGSHLKQNIVGQVNALTVTFPFLRFTSVYRSSYKASFALRTQNPLTRPNIWSYEKIRDLNSLKNVCWFFSHLRLGRPRRRWEDNTKIN
jgi:hypothetical protein